MWEDKKDMGDTEILINHLNKSGLSGEKILERTSEPEVKQKLIKNTEDAVSAGAFGVPTFFLHNQIFWGKEALEKCLTISKLVYYFFSNQFRLVFL